MDSSIALFYLCAIAGIVMVVGSLFLLWKGRIYLDTAGNKVTVFEFPGKIKLSTQFPVLVMFLFGVIMLVFPIFYAKNICPDLSLHRKTFPEMVKVSGKINSSIPMDVYAIIAEQSRTRDVIFNIPYVKNASYRIMASDADGTLKPITMFSLEKFTDTYEFREVDVQTAPEALPDIPKQDEKDKPAQNVVDAYR